MSSALLTTPLPGYRQGSSPVAGLWLVEDIQAFREGVEGDSGWALAFGGIALAADAIAFMLDPIGQLIGHGLSWVLEHLNPLASWLDQLTGDAAGVLAMSEKLKFVESELANIQTKLGTMRQALNAQSGQTVSAASAFFADIEPQIGAIASASSGVGTALEIGSSIVQVVHDLVRDALSEIAGTAISAALVSAATLGMALPAEIANIIMMVSRLANKCGTAISHVVSVFSKIKGHMAKLWSALGELIAKLAKYAGDTKAGKRTVNVLKHAKRVDKPDGWKFRRSKNTTAYWDEFANSRWDDAGILARPRIAEDSTSVRGAMDLRYAYRSSAGDYLTEAEWNKIFARWDTTEQKYVLEWPSAGKNSTGPYKGLQMDGAVSGSIKEYGNVTDYLKAHPDGLTVGRTGYPGGKFVAPYVEGKPQSFTSLSLPPGQIRQPLYEYELTGYLPEKWTIRTGEVTPHFGFEGGGTQMQIFNAKGFPVSIQEATARGVIEK